MREAAYSNGYSSRRQLLYDVNTSKQRSNTTGASKQSTYQMIYGSKSKPKKSTYQMIYEKQKASVERLPKRTEPALITPVEKDIVPKTLPKKETNILPIVLAAVVGYFLLT